MSVSSRQYVVRRALGALAVVFLAVNLNFFLFRLAPGDAVSRFADVPRMSPEALAGLRDQFGLDGSLLDQWLGYLGSLLRGDLGISYENALPVTENLVDAYVNTLPMVALGVLIALVLGLTAGVLTAWRRGTFADRAITAAGLMLCAAPAQWLGLLLAAAFVGVLPTSGMTNEFLVGASFWDQLSDRLQHMILPSLTFALVGFGPLMLIVRSSLVDVFSEDYILTARAKGLSSTRILLRHALRNAALPIVTWIGLTIGFMASGAILVETVFSWPGFGRVMYSAVISRDWPMLQGGFLAITVSVVFFTFLVDLCYAFLDPRIRT